MSPAVKFSCLKCEVISGGDLGPEFRRRNVRGHRNQPMMANLWAARRDKDEHAVPLGGLVHAKFGKNAPAQRPPDR